MLSWASNSKPSPLPALAITLAILLAELFSILMLNEGFIVYTLDDAYIHLALAENLLHGHYGVNANEYSAPASSILWPFLLAPFSSFNLAPMIINFICALATTLVFFKAVSARLRTDPTENRMMFASAVTLILVLFSNTIGLVFTGMEHSLQLLIVCLIAFGLIQRIETGREPRWIWACVLLAPLVRYENMGVALSALAFLAIGGRPRESFLLFVIITALLALFSGFLQHLGFGLLPTSVLVKSHVARSSGEISSLFANLIGSLESGRGMVLLFLCVCLWGVACFGEDKFRRRLAACASLPGVIHLLAGGYDRHHRYELYALAYMSVILIYLAADAFVAYILPANRARPAFARTKAAALAFFFAFLAEPHHLIGLFSIPTASNNIYEQHYQMHRFAAEFYGLPVGVNDVGYVSYKNPAHVLDYWGLGSPRRSRFEGGPDWMDDLARSYGVKFAMVYERIFQDIPARWIKLGELRLSRRLVTPADGVVTFYALDDNDAPALRELIERFSLTLPSGVEFRMISDPLSAVSE